MNDVTDALCARARAKEAAFDVVRSQADGLLLNAARCEGRSAELDAQRLELVRQLAIAERENESRLHKVWVAVGVVAGLALGFVGGWAVGSL